MGTTVIEGRVEIDNKSVSTFFMNVIKERLLLNKIIVNEY